MSLNRQFSSTNQADFDLAAEIRQFDSQFIEHGRIKDILTEIREVIGLAPSVNEAVCLHISGPPGAGKSTIRHKLAGEYKVVKDGRTTSIEGSVVVADYVPLLQIEMPNNPTVKSICYAILRAFGDDKPGYSSEMLLSVRVDRCFQACGTSALLVDEVQRIVDKKGIVIAEHILDWFKSIHARHGIALIFLGLGRARYLFDQDSQIERRWNAEHRLQEYWWRTAAGAHDVEAQEMFIAILAAYKRILPISLAIDIENESNAFRFFYATQGLVGPLKKILREAIRIAARRPTHERVIDMDILEQAFSRAIRNGAGNLQNPFNLDFDFSMPPRPMDDGALLPTPDIRRAYKRKKARRAALMQDLTK